MSKDFIGDGTFRTLLNLMKNKFNTVDGKITDLESGILQSIKNEISKLDLNSMGAFPTLKLADPNDPDLNNYINTGLWYFMNDGTEWLNLPGDCKDGYLLVFRVNAAYKKQIFFRSGTKNANSFQQYERSYTYVGPDLYEWTDWVRNISKRDPEGMMLSSNYGWIEYESEISASWVRFAKINWNNGPISNNADLNGGAPYSCIISIKRTFNSQQAESHMIHLNSAYQNQNYH